MRLRTGTLVLVASVATAGVVLMTSRNTASAGPQAQDDVAAATALERPPSVQTPQVAPCDAPDTAPFVRDLRDRAMRWDELTAFAVERYGEPVSCEGEVTTEFDGVEYGTLSLTFSDGVVVDVETMPISTGIYMLSRDGGFDDEAEMVDLLRRRAERIGLSIDWETPEISTDGGREERRYRDPDPGLNAAAILVYEGETLISVGMSIAS